MESLDLYTLQQNYNKNGVMMCFNGPLTKSLIEEIGNALRNYMQNEKASASKAMDVFAAYIEMTQNIRHYAAGQGGSDSQAVATLVIAQDSNGNYTISSGNIVDMADGQALAARVQALAGMDKAQLKAAYKEQLRKPREEGKKAGAGLGLLDIARKAAMPLVCSLQPLDDKQAFFSLIVAI